MPPPDGAGADRFRWLSVERRFVASIATRQRQGDQRQGDTANAGHRAPGEPSSVPIHVDSGRTSQVGDVARPRGRGSDPPAGVRQSAGQESGPSPAARVHSAAITSSAIDASTKATCPSAKRAWIPPTWNDEGSLSLRALTAAVQPWARPQPSRAPSGVAPSRLKAPSASIQPIP